MSPRGLLLILLVPLNAGLFWGWKRAAAERDRLVDARADLASRDRAIDDLRERRRRIEELEAGVGAHHPLEDLDIAVLRDLFIGAERGLSLDRLSLDFRPDAGGPSRGGRGRIQASFSGSFDSLYEYLRRIEDLRLPLRPEELSLRPDSSSDSEELVLAASWNGVWSAGTRRDRPGSSFSDEEIARLDRWLSRKRPPVPDRDPFRSSSSSASTANVGLTPVGEARAPAREVDVSSTETDEPPTGEMPSLVGFVLARPELEKDLSRRVLAALRFEGELRLVKIGDVVGPFRVERIEARENVVLVNRTTGERLELFLR